MTLDFLRFSHYCYTNRSEESLDKYLVEINRIPMITPDQEAQIFLKMFVILNIFIYFCDQ